MTERAEVVPPRSCWRGGPVMPTGTQVLSTSLLHSPDILRSVPLAVPGDGQWQSESHSRPRGERTPPISPSLHWATSLIWSLESCSGGSGIDGLSWGWDQLPCASCARTGTQTWGYCQERAGGEESLSGNKRAPAISEVRAQPVFSYISPWWSHSPLQLSCRRVTHVSLSSSWTFPCASDSTFSTVCWPSLSTTDQDSLKGGGGMYVSMYIYI